VLWIQNDLVRILHFYVDPVLPIRILLLKFDNFFISRYQMGLLQDI
jgi:hypothetical protein